MSNTAYTRAAADLENAGLNRILALGSPASTPGGSMPVMGNVMEDVLPAINSAFTNKQVKKLTEKAGKEVDHLDELIDKTIAETENVNQQTRVNSAVANNLETVNEATEMVSEGIQALKGTADYVGEKAAKGKTAISDAIDKSDSYIRKKKRELLERNYRRGMPYDPRQVN